MVTFAYGIDYFILLPLVTKEDTNFQLKSFDSDDRMGLLGVRGTSGQLQL